MCSGVHNRSYPFIYIGEGLDPFLAITNKSHVIRWMTTHEIRIIARVNLTAGARTVWALGLDYLPLLVFNEHIVTP
jgi:hypothetical protein